LQINYFEILRSYNELKIAKQVGSKANSLFRSIMDKANTLRYPESLAIYNSELLDLSGLTKDELHPARNKLLQLKINGLHILKYLSMGTRKAGVYQINYSGFSSFFRTKNDYWLVLDYLEDWSEFTINKDCPEKAINDYSENTINPNTNHTTNLHTNPNTNHDTKNRVSSNVNNITKQTKQNKDHDHDLVNIEKVNIYKSFENNFARGLSPFEIEQITSWLKEMSEDMILLALKKAVMIGKYNFRYIDSIILDWVKNNIRTIRDAEEADKQFEQSKSKNSNSPKTNQQPSISKPSFEDDENYQFYLKTIGGRK